MAAAETPLPTIALIGAGIFVREQYIPRFREISHLFILRAIWSRTEASARSAADLAKDFAPEVMCRYGEFGLEDIAKDSSIDGVAIVLPGQVQVEISLKMLKAGKHVLQEKPAAEMTGKAEAALAWYNSYPQKPIWAVAENYCYEHAFVEARKMLPDIGDLMNIQVIVEGSMKPSNPYFPSSWRRNFTGGFVLDIGVHFVAALRMLVGCEIVMVSAKALHVNKSLPPPDNLCSLFQLETGCAGVLVLAVDSVSPKVFWRVDGTKGMLQIEHVINDGRHEYNVVIFAGGEKHQKAYPFVGITEELKAFLCDISSHKLQSDSTKACNMSENECCPAPRGSYAYMEGLQDVAVIEAMLESSSRLGGITSVPKF